MNHRFHDREWVEKYAETITERRPERVDMFAHIVGLIQNLDVENPTVIELACGPGLLALALLENVPEMRYIGVDFSEATLEVAQEKTEAFRDQCVFDCVDLCKAGWNGKLPSNVDAIVSNMALHDLGDVASVDAVYQTSLGHLRAGGLFVNAELVLNADEEHKDAGRCTADRHLEMLKGAGYVQVDCPVDYGHYACVLGYRE